MTDFKQFAESNLERDSNNLPASSTQHQNVYPPSDFSTPMNTSVATAPLQPLRPRMMIPIPSLSSIPQFPASSGTMNMESLSLVSPVGRSNPYPMSAGFLKSPHDDTKRGRKARRKRTTPAQLAELLKVFESNENPSHDVREMLSKKVGMTNREVQVWFQNRRAKEAHVDKKPEHSDQKASRSPDGSPTDIRDQPSEGPIRITTKKTQPIQAAPYPPTSPVYSYGNSGANQFSAFRRMSVGITPDGRTVFFQQPAFPIPGASSANAQQFVQQPHSMQFMPQTAASFLPSPVSPMQAFPGAPQMMLVPMFASPQGFLPASASGYAYAAPPMYNDSATANEVAGGSRRESFLYWPESATDAQAGEPMVKAESEGPKRGVEALNALASAASEQSLADSS